MVDFEKWLHRYFPHQNGDYITCWRNENEHRNLDYETEVYVFRRMFRPAVDTCSSLEDAHPERLAQDILSGEYHEPSEGEKNMLDTMLGAEYSLEKGLFYEAE